MAIYTDQTNRKIELSSKPLCIISTVPSQTELLYDLGLEAQVVGITAYCVHPSHWLKEKTVIGGTKNLKLDLIRELKPDLIIGNKEENIKEQIEALESEFPVWLSDIVTVDDTLDMISEIGKITETEELANSINAAISEERLKLKGISQNRSVAYFIWNEPMMVAGSDTFINKMLEEVGLTNAFAHRDERYPQITDNDLSEAKPDLIILSSEPYSFTTKHLHSFGEKFANAKVKLMDGEMFSWYGSRMVKAFPYIGKNLGK
ncbi:ABC transporter substrate-binding protein [Owenweeksia hongkongensis]|uniref:ABC transporter substrate-binding protein n=1 Tax=Owenweeksia hongkongensis TaxID=253245 RepID=UPI003A91293E